MEIIEEDEERERRKIKKYNIEMLYQYKEILEEIQNLTTDINLINKLNRKLGITEEEIMARQNEQEILKQL